MYVTVVLLNEALEKLSQGISPSTSTELDSFNSLESATDPDAV
jgi:hypothetical protein